MCAWVDEEWRERKKEKESKRERERERERESVCLLIKLGEKTWKRIADWKNRQLQIMAPSREEKSQKREFQIDGGRRKKKKARKRRRKKIKESKEIKKGN